MAGRVSRKIRKEARIEFWRVLVRVHEQPLWERIKYAYRIVFKVKVPRDIKGVK